jgi:hypothetical protein
MATQINNAAWLEWMASLMGAGSRQKRTATLPPGQFHCLLDELPLHLVPQPQRRRLFSEDAGEPLFLNPDCFLPATGEVPAELERRRDLLRNFYLQGTIAWVRDAATGSWQPFWLGSRLEEIVSRLRTGERVPDGVPREARALLWAAGIVTLENEAERRKKEEWLGRVLDSAAQFKDKRYAPVSGFIHPFHVAALRRYYRHQIRRGAIRLGDEQSSRRYAVHNESVARFFHYQMASVVSAVVEQTVKPSYVYFASYLSGAELKKHIDREQCEFSVTLCLDFSPEPDLATSWPIRLQTAEGKVAVYQALGDGLVYRGTQVPHYRHALPEGCTSTSIFFHYVPEDFSGTLD